MRSSMDYFEEPNFEKLDFMLEQPEPDFAEYEAYLQAKEEIAENRRQQMNMINLRRNARSASLLIMLQVLDKGGYLQEVNESDYEKIEMDVSSDKPRATDMCFFKDEINVYRARHIGKILGISPNKRKLTKLKKPKGHKFKYKLADLITIVEQNKYLYQHRLAFAEDYAFKILKQRLENSNKQENNSN